MSIADSLLPEFEQEMVDSNESTETLLSRRNPGCSGP